MIKADIINQVAEDASITKVNMASLSRVYGTSATFPGCLASWAWNCELHWSMSTVMASPARPQERSARGRQNKLRP